MWHRTDTSGDTSFQFLCLFDTLPVDIAGMEGGGDDDFGIDNLLVEGRVFAFLVIGDDVGVAMGFEPFSEAEFILHCTEQSGLFLGPFTTLVEDCQNFDLCITSVTICGDSGEGKMHTILS